MKVEVAVEAAYILGEGPCWVPELKALYWVDIVGKRLHRWRPGEVQPHIWQLDELITAAMPRKGGGFVVTLGHRVAFMDSEGTIEPFVTADDDPGNRSNEARCDAAGRLWLGTMHNNIGPHGESVPLDRHSGKLLRIDPDGTVTEHLRGIGISNTLVWSPDGGTLYFADTPHNKIEAFAFDAASGTLGPARPWHSDGPGKPDGSAIDSEGYVWNARWGAGCLLRIAPDGSVERTVSVPARQPTSCAFGGDDMKTLFITSARQDLDDPTPADGSLMVLRTDVPGLPTHAFAG